MTPPAAARERLVSRAFALVVGSGFLTIPTLLAGTVIFACGQALAYPAMVSLALSRAPAAERSAVVGTCTAFVDVAIAFGAFALSGLPALARVDPRAAPSPG